MGISEMAVTTTEMKANCL